MMVIVEQLVEWRLAGDTEVLGENLPQRHFVHHKSHMTRPRLEPGAATVESWRLTAWTMARPRSRLTDYMELSSRLRPGRPGLQSRQEQESFLFSIASRPALVPTHPLMPRSRKMDLYLHSPIRLHGVTLTWLSIGTTLPFIPLSWIFSADQPK
jgi:hypothetical protein